MQVPLPTHGVGGRQDLPLPWEFVLTGAGLALIVSFAVLSFAWRTPRYGEPTPVPKTDGLWLPSTTTLASLPKTIWWGLSTTSAAIYLVVVTGLIAGPDELQNPVFGYLYVLVWVGLIPAGFVLGPLACALSPHRSLHAAICRIIGRDPNQGKPLPHRIGMWPAAAFVAAFIWMELVCPDRTVLDTMRTWFSIHATILLGGAAIFGSRWFTASDPFENYARLVSALSPLRLNESGQLALANPLQQLNNLPHRPGMMAFICIILGSTAFDSLADSLWWIGILQTTALPQVPFNTTALVSVIAVVVITYWLSARWTFGASIPPAERPRHLLPSLVPIVIGYGIAHYLTLFLIEGQRTIIHLSDPLVRGWNLLGTAQLTLDTTIMNQVSLISTLQLAAVVIGHVIAVVSAHEKSVQVLPHSKIWIGQLAMLVVMVGYTVGGLSLLFID